LPRKNSTREFPAMLSTGKMGLLGGWQDNVDKCKPIVSSGGKNDFLQNKADGGSG